MIMLYDDTDTFSLVLSVLRKQAQRLCNRYGIRSRTNEKPGLHLPYDHPALEAIRSHVQKQIRSMAVHPRLVANFDQVWVTWYRPQKKTLMKDSSARGLKDPLMKSLLLRQIRHGLERVLDLPMTEGDPSAPKPLESRLNRVQGGPAASAAVEGWRNPRTLTTLSFIDGHIARGFVTVKEIPENTRTKLNKELSRWLYIEKGLGRTHIWNQETLILYLAHLSKDNLFATKVVLSVLYTGKVHKRRTPRDRLHNSSRTGLPYTFV